MVTDIIVKMKDGTGTAEVFFSDEEVFTVETICNRQNYRILATSTGDVLNSMRRVSRRQKPFPSWFGPPYQRHDSLS